MFNRSPSCWTGEVIYNSLAHYVSEKRPFVLCQLCYRTSVLFPSLFVCLDLQNHERLEEHLTSAPLTEREASAQWASNATPKTKKKKKKEAKTPSKRRLHTHLLKEILAAVDSPLGGS